MSAFILFVSTPEPELDDLVCRCLAGGGSCQTGNKSGFCWTEHGDHSPDTNEREGEGDVPPELGFEPAAIRF